MKLSIRDKKPKKKNQKYYLVFIYGFISVGKFTIAKELAKLTNYKILHNHMIIDLIGELFEHKRPWTLEQTKTRESIHFELTKILINTKNSFIFTHTYSKSYVSETGMTDLAFLKKIGKIVTKAGGIFCPVYLKCNEKEMLSRIKNKSRKSHRKLRSLKIMKELIKNQDYKTPAPIKNNFLIDTTKISPKIVAKKIKEHFNLQ